MIVPQFVFCYGFLEHFIPYASRLICIKYVAETVESEQDVLIYSLTLIDLTCTDCGDILIFMLA